MVYSTGFLVVTGSVTDITTDTAVVNYSFTTATTVTSCTPAIVLALAYIFLFRA